MQKFHHEGFKYNMNTSCPICKSQNNEFLCAYKYINIVFQNKELLRCNNCTCVFISPMLKDDELNEYYRTYWQSNIQSQK
jgi:hypothetical protein